LLHKTQRVPRLEELGFSPKSYEAITHLLKQPKGLFLVTGPSGSGKTTTVYAATTAIETPEKCVITVEDPVECKLQYASQVQLPADRSFNFADALRAILRQNSNVILIGEIRDAETGIVASEAALTGSLVLSTMLSSDAVGAIHQLLDLGVHPYWLASTMVGVVYQQLIRKICSDCKEEYQAPEDEAALVAPYLQSVPQSFSRGKGCQNCGSTGYKGRTAIVEIVSVSLELRDLIIQRASLIKMGEEAARHGFRGIRVDAAEKVALGLTTISEFIRVLG